MNAKGPAGKLPLNRDLKRLRRRADKIAKVPSNQLDEKICDFIDLRGFALAVLLKRLPSFPPEIQKKIALRIEDFLFTYPERGSKLVSRLAEASRKCDLPCRQNLIAATADVLNRSEGEVKLNEDISEIALFVLTSDTDFVRKGKSVEILSHNDSYQHIPQILKVLDSAQNGIETYANFNFAETVLFALKRLAGDGFLRLMINPQSSKALLQFKFDWRHRPRELMEKALAAIETLSEGFPQLLLKIIDLSEFNLPFLAMIQEGMLHSDKWVRQAATEAFSKIGNEIGLEQLFEMLKDPAQEVRMMAVTTLGHFPTPEVGEKLFAIAGSENENSDIRMNALYALFNQKNLKALEALRESPSQAVSINASGLSSLLMPREEGVDFLIAATHQISVNALPELFHYLMEIAGPEDISKLVKSYSRIKEDKREPFLHFISSFLKNKAGPKLDKALSELTEGERTAISVIGGKFG